MADTTKKTANNAKKVVVRLPRLHGQNAQQREFFSVNGRNCLLHRGIDVEASEEVAEVIRNAERAEECAMHYVDKLVQNEEDKRKETLGQ